MISQTTMATVFWNQSQILHLFLNSMLSISVEEKMDIFQEASDVYMFFALKAKISIFLSVELGGIIVLSFLFWWMAEKKIVCSFQNIRKCHPICNDPSVNQTVCWVFMLHFFTFWCTKLSSCCAWQTKIKVYSHFLNAE